MWEQANEEFRALLRRSVAGDRAASAAVWESQLSWLRPTAISKLGSARWVDLTVDDLLQEVALRMATNIGSLASDEPAAFRQWLITIMTHIVAAHYRSRREQMGRLESELLSGGGVDADLPDGGKPPSRVVSESEAFDQMWDCLSKIPPDDAALLKMIYLSGLSYREIAEQTGVALSALGGRLQRARSRMVTCMGGSSAYDIPGVKRQPRPPSS